MAGSQKTWFPTTSPARKLLYLKAPAAGSSFAVVTEPSIWPPFGFKTSVNTSATV